MNLIQTNYFVLSIDITNHCPVFSYLPTLLGILHIKYQKCSDTRVSRELFELWINHRNFFYMWKSHVRKHKHLENFNKSSTNKPVFLS